MERYNMTVKQFADYFLPSNAKIKVVKSSETVLMARWMNYIIMEPMR